jgi:hypothetical protein
VRVSGFELMLVVLYANEYLRVVKSEIVALGAACGNLHNQNATQTRKLIMRRLNRRVLIEPSRALFNWVFRFLLLSFLVNW